MRVLEPAQIKRRSIRPKKRTYNRPLLVLLAISVLGVGWYYIQPEKIDTLIAENITTSKPKPTEPEKVRTKIRTFTNQEFVNFYSSFAYPNTSEVTTPPSITGNGVADARIRSIAETRGYRLRSVPISPPIMIDDGFELQQKALQPFIDMQTAARKLGYSISLTAAFRSIETQRDLFLSRLAASPTDIAAGAADAAVNQTLMMTAPPGYSRHHNGFTVDFSCGSVGGEAFLNSGCYAWLSKNNFENAKNYGWIPSYPQGAHASGPEPEAWEFVWVGRESLLE